MRTKSNRYVFAFAIIYVSVLFALIIGFYQTRNRVVYLSDERAEMLGGEAGILCDGVSVKPGIYQVILDYEMTSENSIDRVVFVQDDALSDKQLRCSGGPIYDGRNQIDFTFILKNDAENLALTISEGTSPICINRIEIRNTGKQWTVYGTIWTGVFFVLCLGIYIYRRLKTDALTKGQLITLVSLVLIWIVASLPLFVNMTFSTADNGYHMQRIEGVMHALQAGIFPVRIEPHWIQGYGYANGIFYCDLFLYPAAILRLLGFSVTFAYNFYIMMINAALVWVSYKCFNAMFQSSEVAVTLMATYALSCMHFYKSIQTGAIGEATALVFLPLVLLGLYRLLTGLDLKDRQVVSPLAAGASGLICCHVLSTEITIGVVILFLILYVSMLTKTKTWKRIGMIVLGILSLSGWFIVPFLDYYLREDLHIKHVFARKIQHEGLLFPQLYIQFWLPGENVADSIGMYHASPVGVGLILFSALIVFFISWLIAGFRQKGKSSSEFVLEGFAKRCAIISAILMVLSLRVFPWDKIQIRGGILASLISSLQYPNRLLEWAILLATVTLGYILLQVKESGCRFYTLLVFGCVLATVISALYQTNTYMASAKQYYLANPEGMGNGYVSGGEYLIQDTDESKLHYGRVSLSQDASISDFEKGALQATFFAKNNSSENGYVEVPLLHYYGYRAVDNQGMPLEVVSGDNHVVRVVLPPEYDGNVQVTFRIPWYWRVAEVISLSAFIGLVVVLLKNKKKEDGMGCIRKCNPDDEKVHVDKTVLQHTARVGLVVMGALLAGAPCFARADMQWMLLLLAPLFMMVSALTIRKTNLLSGTSILPETVGLLYVLSPISLNYMYFGENIMEWLLYLATFLALVLLTSVLKYVIDYKTKGTGVKAEKFALSYTARVIIVAVCFAVLEYEIYWMNRMVLTTML